MPRNLCPLRVRSGARRRVVMPRADELPIGSARLEAARLDGHSADTEQISSSPGEDDHVVGAVSPDVGFRAALLAPPASKEHIGRVHGLLGSAAGTAELLVNGHAGADSLTRLAHS